MSARVPRPVERLIEAFARLPGIGPKTASRLTYYLLRAAPQESEELAGALRDLRATTRFCSRCHNITNLEQDPCAICVDPTREGGVICVVEDPLDVLAIERTGAFHGRYHVLHGALSPVEGIGPDELRLADLLERAASGEVQELIIATNRCPAAHHAPGTRPAFGWGLGVCGQQHPDPSPGGTIGNLEGARMP